MFNVPIDKIIPVTHARAQISFLVRDVQQTKSLYVLTRGGKPAAILASIEYVNENLPTKKIEETHDLEQYNNIDNNLAEVQTHPTSNNKLSNTDVNSTNPITANVDEQQSDSPPNYDAEEPVKISIK